uniref:Uncharacterized protein n=1 Tax=viral metagenome TaxID=1070528 RepID=A0A6H2A473_9ZZZZ
MVYTHHSFVTCDDCGERHSVGNREDCIEVLKERLEEHQTENAALDAENARLRAVAEAAEGLVSSLNDLFISSEGVVGLHLNGDVAIWDELLENINYSVWLGDPLTALRKAMEGLSKQGG